MESCRQVNLPWFKATGQKLMMCASVPLGQEQSGQVAITLFPHLRRLSGEGRALEATCMIQLDWNVANFVALCVFVHFGFDVLFERVENNEENCS